MQHSGEANVQRAKLIRVRTNAGAKNKKVKHCTFWEREAGDSQSAEDSGDGHLVFMFPDIVKDSQTETSVIV